MIGDPAAQTHDIARAAPAAAVKTPYGIVN